MSTKMERMSQTVLSQVPFAVERLKKAADGHLEVARESRARIRRQRIQSQSTLAIVEEVPEEERLSMPDAWRDDEPTVKTALDEK